MKQIEKIILQNLIHNDTFTRKVIPFLKLNYFQNEGRICFNAIINYVSKYNKLPTKDALILFIQEKEKTSLSTSLQFLEEIFKPVDKNQSEEWLLEETEKWCKDRALVIGILDCVEIVDGKDKKRNRDAMPSILMDALAISFDKSVGHDYFKDFDERYDYYTGKGIDLEKIPFKIDILNKATNGGIETKTLNFILAPSGIGKTFNLCSLAADYLTLGYDCLYITLEMADKKIAQRIDANLMNIEINDIQTMGKPIFEGALRTIETKTKGNLIIKEYPMETVHAGHIRALLDELKLKKNFEPKVVLIDYLGLLISSKLKPDNSYNYYKGISHEIRSLAQEKNIGFWSAAQANRGGNDNSDIGQNDIADSYGVVMAADLMFALYVDEALQQQGKVLFNQTNKNRYEDRFKYPKFFVGCDRAKMKLYDLDDPEC